MKLLIDACLSHRLVSALTAAGHDASWVGDWPRPPSDAEVLEKARTEQRIVVTLDKDFGEMVVLGRQPYPGMIRLVDLPLREQPEACLRVLARHASELGEGALLTVSRDRVRIRPPR